MNDKADVEALASLLEGSGLLEGLSGGKRSHKGQYVRWLIGQIVKKNPKARIGEQGNIHYKPPYNPPFQPSRVQKVNVSDRFGTVARSKFIDKMLSSEKRKTKKADTAPRLVIEEVEEVKEGAKANIDTAEELRKWIIKYSKDGMTTRGILTKIQSDHTKKAGVPLSQPTITRVVKKWREGDYNDDGSVKK